MPYAGIQLQNREVAGLAKLAHTKEGARPFYNRKVEAVAVARAESHLYPGAWHDNLAMGQTLLALHQAEGMSSVEAKGKLSPNNTRRYALDTVRSRDCGLFQINIPSYYIGTSVEDNLRYTGTDRDVARQTALRCANAAADLYVTPWLRAGKPGQREWQPWVAYPWAIYPEAWVWSRVVADTWVATGHYLHEAIRGVVNDHWQAGTLSLEKAVVEGERLADIYGITKGSLYVNPDQRAKGVQWHYPPKPTEPGSLEDYPKPNDGASVMRLYTEGKRA